MRVLKLDKEMKVKLCEAYGNTLIKIGKSEMSSKELDELLKNMFLFFKDLGVDYELIDDVNENIKILEDKKIMKIKKEFESTIDRYTRANESFKALDTNDRLAQHFNESLEPKKKVKQVDNSSLELKTNTPIQGSKITGEQNQVLLTFVTSNKATQEEVTKIKSNIEKGYSFTQAVKLIVKDTKRYLDFTKLIQLQDKRSEVYEASQKRLY